MKLDLYQQSGEKKGTVNANDSMFAAPVNDELMRLLGIFIETGENLKEYPALQEAYKEYLFVRKLILGETSLD